MISYLIEAAIINASILGLYFLLIRNETDFRLRRLVLISSMFFALTVPLINLEIPDYFYDESEKVYTTYLNPAIVGDASSDIANSLTSTTVYERSYSAIYTIYFAISSCILVLLVIGFMKIKLLQRRSKLRYIYQHYIYENPELDYSFSFLNWIFIKQNDPKPIIDHEIAHVKLYHSVDILFSQFFKMLFWWSPASWILLRELRLVHEFQADALAIKGLDISAYKSLLVANTLQNFNLQIASSFHQGQILKRLKTMSLTYRKISRGKMIVLSFFTAFLVFGFSCTDPFENDITHETKIDKEISYSDLPVEIRDEWEYHPEFKYVLLEIPYGELNLKDRVRDLGENVVRKVEIIKPQRDGDPIKVYFILSSRDHFEKLSFSDNKIEEDEIFTFVDHAPEFPGGMQEFYKQIGTQIIYPKEAREQNESGRVYVQFVVDVDGSLKNIEVVKGVSESLDREAERVMHNIPNFRPGSHNGKNVPVKMVLPIHFMPNEDQQEPYSLTIEAIVNNENNAPVSDSSLIFN